MAEQDKFLAMEVKTRKQLEEQEKLKKKKKRNYIVGFSLLGAAALGLTAVYILSTQIWLVDLKYLPYIEYTYSTHDNDGTATLRKVKDTKENPLPEHFVVPKKVNGLTVTKIADNAFAGLENLKSVSMSNNITEIGSYAFAGCKSLNDVKLSNNIQFLGQDVFKNTPFMDTLDTKNDFNNISSFLISISDSYWEKVEKEKGSADTIILSSKDSEIPEKYKNLNVLYLDEVNGTEIRGWSESLFAGNPYIKYVEIPSYLTEVPTYSFSECPNLEKVVFTDETTKIGREAFSYTESLTDVVLGNNITTIGDFAFQESAITKLDVGNNVTEIGTGIFKDCHEIETFTWPEHLDKIPEETFAGCEHLSELNISDVSYNKITSIGKNAFKGTALPSFDFPINLSSVAQGIFEDVDELTSVTMYESDISYNKEGEKIVKGIQSIGYEAFKNTSLEEIVLVDKNKNPVSPRHEVTLPNAVINLSSQNSRGENFGGDVKGTSIKKFTFPYNLIKTTVGMFKNCTELEEIEFLTYHGDGKIKGLEFISMDTFKGCSSITSLDNLPASLQTISSRAFANMANLKSVTIPNNRKLRLIDEGLFENDPNLEKVVIGENIYGFNEYAFKENYKLEYMYIPFVGQLDSNGKSKINLNHGAFYNMKPDVRDADGKVIKTLSIEEKFPIFLNVSKDQCDPSKVFEPKYEPNTDVNDPNNIMEGFPGWYDPATCQPFYKGEWQWVGEGSNARPVANITLQGGNK